MRKFVPLAQSGSKKFDFLGGRRSGKTFFILQILLGRVLQGETVNVAVMTDTQGRLGAYSDIRTIIAGSPSIQPYLDVMSSPREVRCKNGGVMFFNSYAVSERAKGIACDWLFINEANNFTEQQYIDLSASVRKGCFADRNPNAECWSERNGFVLIHSTWKDNRDNLTALQIQWFEDLKSKAESPNATQLDIALYKMYYLGEYAEVIGLITLQWYWVQLTESVYIYSIRSASMKVVISYLRDSYKTGKVSTQLALSILKLMACRVLSSMSSQAIAR